MTHSHAYPWEAAPSGPSAAVAAELRALLPRLDTERCVLRAPEIADFDAYAEILMSDRAQFMNGPIDREGAWADFNNGIASWLLRGHGLWTLTDKGGVVLGFVTVQMEWGDHEPELGFFLREDAEGQGYTTEAANAARAHVLDTLQLPRLVSYVASGNTRSQAVLARLGGVDDSDAAQHFGDDMYVYRHAPAPEARA